MEPDRETEPGGMHHESKGTSGEVRFDTLQFNSNTIAPTSDGSEVTSWQTEEEASNDWRSHHRNDSPTANDDSNRETTRFVTRDSNLSRTFKSGSRNKLRDDEPLSTVSERMIVYICLVFLLCTFVMLGMQRTPTNYTDFILPNGDHAMPCSDRPQDERCIEMTDAFGRIIYRSDDRERKLAFSECSNAAAETVHLKCIGEFAFSYNQSGLWYHRLYHDTEENSYSIISGPEGVGHTQAVPRIRHIVEEPYNWIASFDPLPKNTHRTVPFYVHGEILVKQYTDA